MNELHDIDLKLLIENETGNRFDRQGYINCPFHNEKSASMSIKYFPDTNKYKYKCWGCGEAGDALDFIMKYKGLNYKGAREYLGMQNEKSEKELEVDKIKGFINWQIEKTDHKKWYKLVGLFPFVNSFNQVVYYKSKFLKPDGKKCSSYYHIEGDKVINSRGCDEIPYNLYNSLEGIKVGKVLVIVEGEKDANTINSALRDNNYIATSVKGTDDLSIFYSLGLSIYMIKDTGEAGEKYGKEIFEVMKDHCESFKFINLPGLKALGDNKDVTDWLEAGNNKFDLLNAFKRSLDLKSKYDLQQDFRGIYKQIFSEKKEEWVKIYLSDFNLLEAKRMRFIDDDIEGVKLIFKSCTGETLEKVGPSTVFDDVRSFKNFLGTLDLAFKGKIDDLTDLKTWINKYWAIENEELHQGVKFLRVNDEVKLITSEGTITKDKIDYSIKANLNSLDILNINPITKEELMELKKRIFKFAGSDKTIPIIGTVINNLAVMHNATIKEKLHHLLIVGESGSGKSTILTNVIAAILNYQTKDIKSIGLISNFGLIKDLSTGNYPSLYDEFKPSSLDRYKIQKLSESFRNLYDRTTITRGDKNFKNRDFQLTRPLIIAGEESYPNSEKALIERSCIVYLSRNERTAKHTETMQWIIDNEVILNRFGRALIDIVINMTIEEYTALRDKVKSNLTELSNRPLTTAINITTGIEIFNLLLAKHGMAAFEGYESFIVKNIKDEILEGAEDTLSTVERMFVLYNQMLEDGRAGFTEIIDRAGDSLYIKTSEMLNEIFDFINKTGSAEVIPLKLKDFKKQAMKAGYLIGTGSKSKVLRKGNKSIRYDVYNSEKMKKLKVEMIIEPDFIEEIEIDGKGKVIGGVF